jgi:hypothetical protein
MVTTNQRVRGAALNVPYLKEEEGAVPLVGLCMEHDMHDILLQVSGAAELNRGETYTYPGTQTDLHIPLLDSCGMLDIKLP